MTNETLIKTGLDTVVTTGALVSTPALDIQEPKALIIALATSVIVQLTIKGLQFLAKKIEKIFKKDKDDFDSNDKMQPAS